MIKLLLFFAFLLALASGFSLVADLPGHVLLQIGETELRASLITGLIALIALVIVLMVLWTILRVVLRLPGLIGLALGYAMLAWVGRRRRGPLILQSMGAPA